MSISGNTSDNLFNRLGRLMKRSLPAPDHSADDANIAPPDPVKAISEALEALNCSHTPRQLREGYLVWEYTFQGGKFVIHFPGGSQFALLSYMAIGEWDSDALEPVRRLCNELTDDSIMAFLTYRLSPQTNKVIVDIGVGFPAAESNPPLSQLLTHYMLMCFSLQRKFYLAFDKITDADRVGDYAESQMRLFDRQRLELLAQFDVTAPDNAMGRPVSAEMTVGQLIEVLFAERFEPIRPEVVSVKVIASDSVANVTDPAEAGGLNIVDTLADNDNAIVIGRLNAGQGNTPTVLINIDRMTGSDNKPTARVTATLSGVPPRDNLSATSERRKAAVREVYIPLSMPSDSAMLTEYDFMWNDAIDKINEGNTSQLTEEQQMLVDMAVPAAGFDIYHGTRLFNRECYPAALSYLLNAAETLKPLFHTLTDDGKSVFLTTTFKIGICYARMGSLTRALYYFDILFQANNIEWTTAYIDCLTALGDIRTRHIVESIIDRISEVAKNNGGLINQPDYIVRFMGDLHQRLAALYIDEDMLDEAETVLRPMLDDELHKDFAMKQMARISRMRKKNENKDDSRSTD